jgi:hypothetical protein
VSSFSAELITIAQRLFAQLKITALNVGDIAVALGHIHLPWLIRPFVVIVVLWVIFKIVKKVKK